MRLGLESPPPRMAPPASGRRRSSPAGPRASAFSPISVDGDSTDDAEPQPPNIQDLSAFSSPTNGPSLLDLSSNKNNNNNTSRRRDIHYESSDGSEHKNEEGETRSSLTSSPKLNETKAKTELHFFFNMSSQSPPKKARRDSSNFGAYSRSTSAVSPPAKDDELHEVIYATRAIICGQKFDRCELEFGKDRVELTVWKEDMPKWQGKVKYAHMVRFCFSQADRPPYILLMELDIDLGRSDFATFYDPMYAQVLKNETRAIPKVYGIIFFFDEVMDYMRCQSMGDNNPMLADFFREKLSEKEVREFSRFDASNEFRYPRRTESKSSVSSSSTSAGRSLATMVGKTAKTAIGSMASFFRPLTRSSVLEVDDSPSVVRDRGSSSRGRTLDLSIGSNGVSPAHFGEDTTPISIDDASTTKQDRGLSAEDGAQAVVVIKNTQHEPDDKVFRMDASTSSSPHQEEKKNEKAETRKRAASSRREDERLKRRRIESRRNETLLTYPYDGSDTTGRISVTLGDVDRLVPGEFLNDNIIDFYLRYLWRHLDSWQQNQTYFFTSHFFTQLNGTNGAHELETTDPDERFARVARWTQKETNLFGKKFIFIPINDSFHWSIAVFCNPGSAIIKRHRKVRRRRRPITDAASEVKTEVVDLVDDDGGSGDGISEATRSADGIFDEEVEEEEVQSCQEERLAHPPCLLFLDSLRCHRKKKFTKMLRNYLECEWKARYASSAATTVPKEETSASANGVVEEDTIVTLFDSESIGLFEPNIPLQSNSSDCGVFLLMYALSIVRLFPAGVTRDDLESNLTSMLTPNMFRDEHVLEFREYLQQLLFCLQFLEKCGLPEGKVKEEELEFFTID